MWMYITNPKWIKLDELRKIHWSKNEELKNKILKSKDFKSLEEEWFEVKDWLEKIFSWEEISSWSSYNEVYALQLIINETWVSLPYENDIKVWIETDYIEQFLKKDFEIKEEIIDVLFWNPADFFIKEQDDMPIFGIVELELLKTYQNIFSKLDSITEQKLNQLEEEMDDEESEEKFYAYEHLKWIKENIDFCVKNELDLIVFMY